MAVSVQMSLVPKLNTQYVVDYGARKQVQDWEPSEEDNVLVVNDAPLDAFAQVEKAKKTKERTSAHEARIAELEEHSANHWADPFRANAHLRSTFREERRAMYEQQKRDVDLRKRIGWDDDRLLLPRSSKEAGYSTPEIRRKWTQAQEERHKAQLFAPSSKRAHSAMTKELNPAARTLAERLLSKSLMPKHKTRK